MPFSWVLINFSLNHLEQAFVWRLVLPISLSIIRWRIQQFNSQSSSKVFKLIICEHCPLISGYHLRNLKSVNNLLLDECNYVLWRCRLQRDCLYLLGEVIYGCQNKLMPFARWWTYLAVQINSPSSERPLLNYGIHNRRWSPLDITKPLAFRTSSVILKTIIQHRRPKVPTMPNYPLHFIGRLMSTTNTLMYFFHN